MKSKLHISDNGAKEWRLPNGDLHREDGPAVENFFFKIWFINGKKHREDGPAIEYNNGNRTWSLYNKDYTEQEYKKKMRLMKLKHIL